jgi:hypothetical protein
MANVPAITTSKLARQPAAAARSPGATTRRAQARHGLDAGGGVLHIGTVALPTASVTRYRATGLSEKDLSTAFATIAIFSGVAAVMTFLVVEAGWRTKFLLEGVLFGGLAICAMAELFSARRSTMFTFELTCDDGVRHNFSTADRVEAEALRAALEAAGAQVR